MLDTFAALQLAQLEHERALQIAADADPPSEGGITPVRQSALQFAVAVARYSEAAMAWLSFTDLHREEAAKFARSATKGAGA